MLYTYRVKTDALPAVTHVNGTARIQTVSIATTYRLNENVIYEFRGEKIAQVWSVIDKATIEAQVLHERSLRPAQIVPGTSLE